MVKWGVSITVRGIQIAALQMEGRKKREVRRGKDTQIQTRKLETATKISEHRDKTLLL